MGPYSGGSYGAMFLPGLIVEARKKRNESGYAILEAEALGKELCNAYFAQVAVAHVITVLIACTIVPVCSYFVLGNVTCTTGLVCKYRVPCVVVRMRGKVIRLGY